MGHDDRTTKQALRHVFFCSRHCMYSTCVRTCFARTLVYSHHWLHSGYWIRNPLCVVSSENLREIIVVFIIYKLFIKHAIIFTYVVVRLIENVGSSPFFVIATCDKSVRFNSPKDFERSRNGYLGNLFQTTYSVSS